MDATRLETVHVGDRTLVRLKFPSANGGQVLRPDILADTDRLANYLNDWAVAWAHEDGLAALEGADLAPAFDPARFAMLMEADPFLALRFERLRREAPDLVVMEAMFNTYVVEDGAMIAAYNAA